MQTKTTILVISVSKFYLLLAEKKIQPQNNILNLNSLSTQPCTQPTPHPNPHPTTPTQMGNDIDCICIDRKHLTEEEFNQTHVQILQNELSSNRQLIQAAGKKNFFVKSVVLFCFVVLFCWFSVVVTVVFVCFLLIHMS